MNTAVKRLARSPIARLTANPFTGPLPKYIRITAQSSVVKLPSSTAEKAFSYPRLTALANVLPAFSSSRMRSKTSTLASTAMPRVRMIPAMPGMVIVAPNAAIAPRMSTTLTASAATAITPARK